MRQGRLVSLAVVLVLTLSFVVSGTAASKWERARVESVEEGRLFCPRATLVFSGRFIPAGRCFALSVLRDTRGTFLAFVEPGVRIPPGQLVRLSTPAGAKLRGRIFFLVPVQTSVVLVPINTIALVPVRIEDFGPRLSITVISQPAPNVTVIFNVQQ
jgi:hypothetical protein